jgi:hypothetical protein
VGDDNGLGLQRIAQGMRHDFRIAEIAPLYRRTEAIGAYLADPFANGEGAEKVDTFTIPGGCRRRVYRPGRNFDARWRAVNSK